MSQMVNRCLDRLWDWMVDSAIALFIPLVHSYFLFTASPFFIEDREAHGLAKTANQLLSPCNYLWMGQSATQTEEGEWHFEPLFTYDSHFTLKTAGSVLLAIPSFATGCLCKGISLLFDEHKARYDSIKQAWLSHHTKSNASQYKACGISFLPPQESPWFSSQGFARRPGDERNLALEKEGLKEVGALLDEAEIPWWLDCGSCLGAYRYGGAIPWDQDIDVAILQPDFDNVHQVLRRLDPARFIVEDWSSREHPKSCLKVFLCETNKWIDVYCFAINAEKKEIQFIFALKNAWFFPEWWKIREGRFTIPVSFEHVFPLQRANFDGVSVNIPAHPTKYLQRYYGENLAPAKIYDPCTGQYEKDLTHPYWQQAYVH
jgi:hypothetical protein